MKKTIIRQGFYRDSVSLMQVSKEVSESCISALIAMATELNCDLAIQMGFELPKVSPNDLLICLETQSENKIEDLLEQIDQIFSRKDNLHRHINSSCINKKELENKMDDFNKKIRELQEEAKRIQKQMEKMNSTKKN